MNWPQIVVLAVIAFGLIHGIVNVASDRTQTNAWLVVRIAIHLALSAGYAWVLHAGGFW